MLSRMAKGAILATGVLLMFVTLPLLGQGIERKEYTGLDKYPTQGRPEASSMVGVRAAEFLEIPVGARGIGMGSAYTAVADDISAMWWNPAGLGFLESAEFMCTVVDYTLDLTYTYLAGAVPISDGRITLGGFIGYLDIPDEEITTITSPNGTGSFYNSYDVQIGGSFAINLSDRFTTGINVKFIHQDFFQDISSNAMGFDAGGIYHTELWDKDIKFSFAIQNLGTNMIMRGDKLRRSFPPQTMGGGSPDAYGDYSTDPFAMVTRSTRSGIYDTHSFRLPTCVKLALAYNLYTDENVNWLAAGEVWRNSSIPISYSTGTEVSYKFTPFLTGALRLGWKIMTDEYTEGVDEMGSAYFGDDPTFRGLSFGGGFRQLFGARHVEFNYAYRNKGRLSADNFFTIKFGF